MMITAGRPMHYAIIPGLIFIPITKGTNANFYNDHTGEDFTIIYYPNGMTDELKTSFYWDWKDEYFDSFYVEYANGTDYYEDVRIGNEYLKCFLNGDRVTFEAFHW